MVRINLLPNKREARWAPEGGQGWILAIVLAMATSPLYAAYADEASRPLQLSALTDQQLAAGIMWVPGSIAYTIAIVLVAYRMLEPRSARGDGRPARALPTGVG